MESRPRKFKADISDDYAQKLLKKGQKRYRPAKAIDSAPTVIEHCPYKKYGTPIRDGGSATITIQSLPSDALRKHKTLPSRERRREYSKPENWIQPVEKPKPSRREVMLEEYNNITKSASLREEWSRSCRCLVTATRQSSIKSRTSDDDQHVGPVKKLLRTVE